MNPAILHAIGAASNNNAAPAASGTWDFSVGESASGLSIQANGGSGLWALASKRLQLAPLQATTNSVTVKATGTYTRVRATFRLDKRANETEAYFGVSIGQGAITDLDGTGSNWWFTGLANGYIAAIGSDRRLILRRMNNAGTAPTSLGITADLGTGIWWVDHELDLQISAGTIIAKIDGVTQLSVADSTYANGSALVSQGAFVGTPAAGGFTSIKKIILT